MKKFSKLIQFIFISSLAQSQIVDLFVSDWYIGFRGDGTYNNVIELYNPKDMSIDLSNYLFRRTQNGSDWRALNDAQNFIRISGMIPPGETFTIAREQADDACDDCANRTYENGDPAGYIDPNSFMKHNGNDAFGIFFIGGLGDDIIAWEESGTLLDAVGVPGSDAPETAWDVSGVPEATRYHILQRKFSVCGGNGGDWNTSRGCVDEECTETSATISEWEVINCVLSDPNGPSYPEPEESDATADMELICGGHGYFCLDAPNSPPGEFSLVGPVSNSNLNVNENNLTDELHVSWTESYDSDGHDLYYVFDLYNQTGDTLYSQSVENQLEMSISFQSFYDLLGVNNSLTLHWDMYVTDVLDSTQSGNGPFLINIALGDQGGLDQPPGDFTLSGPEDYTLLYIDINNLMENISLDWGAAVDPDGGTVTYSHIIATDEELTDVILEVEVGTENTADMSMQNLHDLLENLDLEEAALYWDIHASDGAFGQNSTNGPFFLYVVLGEDPAAKDETYNDLFISDWYIGYRSNPTYNAAVEMYNPTSQPLDLSNYILRRTQNGSHWLSTSWIRLSGILPPNETYVLTRQASDASLQECADLSEPDDFLKHNGDDGFKITHIGYLPEALSDDETAWLKMGITLDAIGYADNDPGNGWEVAGVSEATRYHMLTRNSDVCGGNAGDWDSSRGCIDEECTATSAELAEWTPTQCAMSPAAGDMPEDSDASADAIVFCGNHNYFCATASVSQDIIPMMVNLEQNYPNPFNPKTEIKFSIAFSDNVSLKIYNISGQEIITLVDSKIQSGQHIVEWLGKDSFGYDVASGMYIYELVAGDIVKRKKLILLK